MNLFYRDTGSGKPVVILHGLYGSSDNWLQIAGGLSGKFRVIAVDLRNHGASPHSSEHTYSEMLTDLAWLFHEAGIEQAHIVGHSMGGKVAIAFAADYPEKVLSLTVVDIAPVNYLEKPASALQYDFHKNLLDTLLKLDITAYKTRKEVDRALKDDIKEAMVRQFVIKNLHRNKNSFEWKINLKALRSNLDEIIGGVDAAEFDDRIPILQYPVLFIKGGLSGYIRESETDAIKRMYPESEFATIDGASHLVHAEKPDEFLEVLKNHLSKIH